MESATENNRHSMYIGSARVKMCGKSAQDDVVIYRSGKPYLEQDKIGTYGRLFQLIVRVCRLDTWLSSISNDRTESGLSATLP